MVKIALSAAVVLFFIVAGYSQNTDNPPQQEQGNISARYGKKGLEIKSSDGLFSINPAFRFQFRFFTPYDADPRSIEGFNTDTRPTVFLRRVRFKMSGHIGKPYFRYAFQYDFVVSNLLDANLSFTKLRGFNITIGQYKAPYNRQREISSSKQLLVERSIVNRAFTIDRQVGVTFSGNLGGENVANFNYWASVYTGTGSLSTVNDDKNLMYAGRLQWNFLGKEMDLGENDSDLENSAVPKASVAVAGATNISPYTRFSSSGGSLLDAFLRGEPGQYKIDQLAQDFLIKYKGLSLLQELHYKEVDDRINDVNVDMRGYLVQIGVFPGYLIEGITEKLQLAFRYAYDDENTSANEQSYRDEFVVGANYYFNKFRNRLQADFSVLDLRLPTETINKSRFRIQWDITF